MRLKPSPPLTLFLCLIHAAELLTLASTLALCRPALAHRQAQRQAQTAVVTWYTGDWRTASGRRPGGHVIAADESVPFGSRVVFVSRGGRVWRGIVGDRGPAIQGRHYDISPAGFRALSDGRGLGAGVLKVRVRVGQ